MTIVDMMLYRAAAAHVFLLAGLGMMSGHDHRGGAHALTAAGVDGYFSQYVRGFAAPDQFKFEWKQMGNELVLRLTVKTSGWIAVGICEPGSGGMGGTDMAVAHVDDAGVGHVTDYYSTGTFQPLVDDNQDWHVVDSAESAQGVTTMTLRRLLETPDSAVGRQDRTLELSKRHATRFAFAYGTTDPREDGTFSMHKEKVNYVVHLGRDPTHSVEADLERGADDTYVLNAASPFKTYQGRLMREKATHGDMSPLQVSRELYYEGTEAPKGAYYNILFRIPGLIGRTLTGFKSFITEENRAYLHHFVLQEVRCPLFPQDSDSEWLRNQASGEPDQVATLAEWIPGVDEEQFLTNDGVASGFVFGNDCLLVNYHFDYLPPDRVLSDNTGAKLYVSDTPPTLERGNLEVADGLVQTRDMIKAGSFSRFVYDCPAKFTEYVVPEDGVKVDAAVLHMHGTGQYMQTSFARNGVVYKNLTIEYFHIDQQQRLTFEPFELRKGDTITTTCIYKPQGTKDVKFGLYSDDEMCIAWLEHYPAMKLSIPADRFTMSGGIDWPIPVKCVYKQPGWYGPPAEMSKIAQFRAGLDGTHRSDADRSVAALTRQFDASAGGSNKDNGAGRSTAADTLLSLLLLLAATPTLR